MHVAGLELRREVGILGADFFIHVLRVTDEVHLIDRHDDARDAQKRRDETVPPGLRQDAVAGVDENHRQVARRSARGHVARVLLVPGRIGDDEFAFRGRKIAVGHVDGNALLAFGLQAVGQQGEVDLVAGRAVLDAVAFDRGKLILVDHL